MTLGWIRVHVGGRHAGARFWVTFTDARGRETALAVDETNLAGNWMLVNILDENDGESGLNAPFMQGVRKPVQEAIRPDLPQGREAGRRLLR